MKVGDRVKYVPRALEDDTAVEDTVITMFEHAGQTFNQPMAVIEGVEHWVPAYDLCPIDGDPLDFTVTEVGQGIRYQRDDLLDALEYLVECSPCQNDCDPSDMSCATNRAKAVIARVKGDN